MTAPMDTLVERMRQLHDAGWVEQLAVDDGSMPCGYRGALPASYGRDTPPDVADVVTRLRLHRG